MPPPTPPKDVSDVDTEEDDEQIIEDDVVWKREVYNIDKYINLLYLIYLYIL